MSKNATSHHKHTSKQSHKHQTKQAHKVKKYTKRDKATRETEQREAQERIGILPSDPTTYGGAAAFLSTSNFNKQAEFEDFEEAEDGEDYESFPSRETLREDRDY